MEVLSYYLNKFATSLIVLHSDWKRIADEENVWFAEERENDEKG